LAGASRPPSGRAAEARGPDAATLAAFVVLVVVAGGNAPAIRYVSCDTCELDPFWGGAMRFLLAALLFAGVAGVLRVGLPRGRGLLGATLFGLLQFGAGFGLIYWGFVHTPAGLGQVLLACVPLLTFGLALAHGQERFRWEGGVGAALAVAGTAVVFGSGLDADVPLSSMLAIVAGGLCWAEAPLVVKAFPALHPAATNAVAMAVGAAVLLVLAWGAGEQLALPESASTWGAQAYLVLAGSLGVFWLYVLVLHGWTASAASYQLVLVPLVTVAVSAWLQDEPVTWAYAAGSVLVLVGVYVGALRRPRAPAGARVRIRLEAGERARDEG
jgi:drug/metabolite transporter (DMT)-like permease